MTPILKWAGGKKRVMPQLLPLVPWGKFTRVFEPFLGGAAFFFSIDHDEYPAAILSDANRDLIRFYSTVATSASTVAANACALSKQHSSSSYLRARELFNALRLIEVHSPAMAELHAGLLLYLNRCGYNGLYRVNRRGAFNTPPNASSTWNPTVHELCQRICPAQSPLRRATLLAGTYSEVFAKHPPRAGDFVFCDPPYVPHESEDGFTGYTGGGFDEKDLAELESELGAATSRGALFMLTHRDTPFVRQLFKGYHISEYLAPRSIAADGGKRQPVKELCIRSYP